MSKKRKHPRVPKTLMVLPEIQDEWPADVKNAMAIRNACSVEMRCPDCGCTPTFNVDKHGILHATFQHEDGCACLTDPTRGS